VADDRSSSAIVCTLVAILSALKITNCSLVEVISEHFARLHLFVSELGTTDNDSPFLVVDVPASVGGFGAGLEITR
jgi:hypothetical protein